MSQLKHKDKFEVRKIQPEELSLIKNFPPKEWNLDLEELFRFHYDESYFNPFVAVNDYEIVGTGIATINGDVAWLGTIIVKESHRNQGIGSLITKELVNYAESKRCRSIVLIATELGYHVYSKLGFVKSSNYIFLKGGKINTEPDLKMIEKIKENELSVIESIDYQATGEYRKDLLIKTFSTGFKYINHDEIEGYYLPDFGRGLIVAITETAGINLMRYKLLHDTNTIVIPENNQSAYTYLKDEGFNEFMRAPRMYLHNETGWNPKMIYSRGAGYCG